MRLPDSFKERMKNVLGDEYDTFIASFDEPSLKGVRMSTSKLSPEDYETTAKILDPEATRVPWTSCGFYITNDTSGKDPYYHAGVYYPQEPSAMLPAEVIKARPGEVILDLCAAPGGKACRIGDDLKGEGLLVANEINAERSKALNRNIERTGITNCIILNEDPDSIAARLPGFFDKILIDAPCSGEGMFRRDPRAVKSWEDYGPEQISRIQYDILCAAAKMLKKGGEIVYSTCTFAEIEDELMIGRFIESHPVFTIVPHSEIEGVTHNPDGSMRIWPHKAEGDGHFCVHLKDVSVQSDDGVKTSDTGYARYSSTVKKSYDAMITCYEEILTDDAITELKALCEQRLVMRGEGMYLMPCDPKLLNGLKVVKSGLFLGEIKMTKYKRIFDPSNSFPLCLTRSQISDDSFISYSRDDEGLIRYLKGETIAVPEELSGKIKDKGLVVIAVDGFVLGLGKIQGTMIKNMYPKAWRLL